MRWYTLLFLIILLLIVTLLGGVIYHFLESDHEAELREEVYAELNAFLEEHSCVNNETLAEIYYLLKELPYSGIILTPNGTINATNWDLRSSIFVALQLLATIGFPMAEPQSEGGRAFAIIYSIFGIPLFLITAIGMGTVLSSMAEGTRKFLIRCCNGSCRPDCGAKVFRTFVILAIGTVLFVVIPSIIFANIEPWSYGDAFYFTFITLATIGFGDLLPSYNNVPWMSEEYRNWYRLAIAFWILLLSAWFAGVLVAIQTTITKAALTSSEQINTGACDHLPDNNWDGSIWDEFKLTSSVKTRNRKLPGSTSRNSNIWSSVSSRSLPQPGPYDRPAGAWQDPDETTVAGIVTHMKV